MLLLPPVVFADLPEETRAQLYFRPGQIVRERFDPADYRMSRRRRWQLQEQLRERKEPTEGEGSAGDTPTTPVTEERAPEAINPELEDRLRSYVRRGQCPRGLPAQTQLRCMAMLQEALPKREHPSARLLLRRGRNVRQNDRLGTETGLAARMEKRLGQVQPRPRSSERRNPRMLDREAGRDD